MNAPIDKLNTQPLKPLARRMPKYKRSFVARQLKKFLKWVQRLMEEETNFNLVATRWSKATITCKGCKTVLSGDNLYCCVCGFSTCNTPPLVHKPLNDYQAKRGQDVDTLTGRITMGALPGETVKDTISRLRKLGAFNEEGRFK